MCQFDNVTIWQLSNTNIFIKQSYFQFEYSRETLVNLYCARYDKNRIELF